MIPQLPDDRYCKKLHRDLSAISPSDEQCDRMLRNVLSATAQTGGDASYTEVMKGLRMTAAKERRHRRVAVGTGAAVVAMGLSIALVMGLRLWPGGQMQLVDEPVPLSDRAEEALPRYLVEVSTTDGMPAKNRPDLALRGLRCEDGLLYFYFENNADDTAWQALSATSGDLGEISSQPVPAAPHMVRFACPDSGLDILVEDARGERVVVSIRLL